MQNSQVLIQVNQANKKIGNLKRPSQNNTIKKGSLRQSPQNWAWMSTKSQQVFKQKLCPAHVVEC